MPKKPTILWELNLGHLLTMIGLAGTAFAAVNHVETRLVEHEVRIKAAEDLLVQASKWQNAMSDQVEAIRSQISEVQGELKGAQLLRR